MPATDTPRQKKHASKLESCCSMLEKSRKLSWISSRSFASCFPVALRTTVTTLSTSGSIRHSRKTPCPTIPVAPKSTTRMSSLEPVRGAIINPMPATQKQFQLAARPNGLPKESDFNLVEAPLAAPQQGEVLA